MGLHGRVLHRKGHGHLWSNVLQRRQLRTGADSQPAGGGSDDAQPDSRYRRPALWALSQRSFVRLRLLVESTEKWKYWHGSLLPIGAFGHGGAGGCAFWVDPVNEIVGVYFEVTMRVTGFLEHLWNYDLFQNAVTAAVAD